MAEIYGYEVKRLNEQVKRNIARFPDDFMFQLTKDEIPDDFSKSQFATLNENGDKRGTNIKKLPWSQWGRFSLTHFWGELIDGIRQVLFLIFPLVPSRSIHLQT